MASLRLHAHTLQALGVPSHLMDGDSGRELLNAIMKFHTIREDLSDHRQHVAFAERNTQHLMAHAAAGGVSHLGILDVIARIGKEIVVAGMVPMHVRRDHVVDFVGRNTERLQTLSNGMDDLAGALLCRHFIETRVADESAVRTLDNPNVVGDRCHLVMRIAKDVILRALAGMSRVTDSVHFVSVVAHRFFSVPTMTPARFSIILTMAVKSLSPPYSALVVSHCSSTARMTWSDRKSVV